MFYTVTLSPALDCNLEVSRLTLGAVNRAERESLTAGGKGINVSVMLKRLGIDSVAGGFLAGHVGDLIGERLREEHIETDFIRIAGESRINVKIGGTEETAVNAKGPVPTASDISLLLERVRRLTIDDTIVLSGRIANGMSEDIYAQLIAASPARSVVDTSGPALLRALPARPEIIKPNLEELEEASGIIIESEDALRRACRKLQDMGARNLLVSLGSAGAVYADEGHGLTYQKAPAGRARSTVGSGDSLLAGFLAGTELYNSVQDALKLAVCAGSATAFSRGLGSAEEISSLLEKLDED